MRATLCRWVPAPKASTLVLLTPTINDGRSRSWSSSLTGHSWNCVLMDRHPRDTLLPLMQSQLRSSTSSRCLICRSNNWNLSINMIIYLKPSLMALIYYRCIFSIETHWITFNLCFPLLLWVEMDIVHVNLDLSIPYLTLCFGIISS